MTLPPARSATELLALFRDKTLSPVDTLRSTMARIEAINPTINALTTLCLDRAIQDARASERRYQSGTARPLDGLPFVAKDLLDSADVRTTYGSVLYRDNVPTTDATAIARLRLAGAILVGKAATHEFAWGLTTSSSLHGQTRNPWNLTRIPGGSSGGSAAALAAGLVPIALGTDTGGSIRIPSAFCGTAGLKPSRGRVPGTGTFALAPSLDHVGPMARSAADLQGILSVLDGTCAPAGTLPKPETADLRGVRILVVDELHPVALVGDHADTFAQVCSCLRGLGASVLETRWPLHQRPDPYRILAPTLNAEARILHEKKLGLYPARAADYSPDVRARLELAGQYQFADYVEAAERRAAFGAALCGLLADADVLLSPVSAVPPPCIGSDLERVDHDGRSLDLRTAVIGFCATQNLTGLPACAIRAGFDCLGLPVGVQLTGRFGEDHRLLRIAVALESALGTGHRTWPDLAIA
ncbi:MAG TPA: amidase [Aliidongia sp.]|uniref:amidase n=1 Tax=Aliidongia sp. TaxID=1914230 RepID=UPI002DDCC325|nr:amidase [Aliidongia sp.]HEV2678778.1 amidase [Aliidongia sp.]